MKILEINNVKIGTGYKPYFIAELSANHGGSINNAKNLIKLAKRSGANAVKIQSYSPETMTIRCDKDDFQIKEGLWMGKNLYELYEEAQTPFEWHKDLYDYAQKIGLTIFSTPFDETAVDLLEKLNTPAYKIASFELTDLDLIEYVAKKNKPIFISTGMASIEEISLAIESCKKKNNEKILLFHCISSYPTELKDSHLYNISYLSKEFNTLVGLSDHTTDNYASIIAVSLGASAIEKHFKINNKDSGPDSDFSIVPEEFKQLVAQCNLAHTAIGNSSFKRSESESLNRRFRRSLYFVKDLKKGHFIAKDDFKKIRPGFGLNPKYSKDIIGKKLKTDVEFGDPVAWNAFEY